MLSIPAYFSEDWPNLKKVEFKILRSEDSIALTAFTQVLMLKTEIRSPRHNCPKSEE